MNRLLLVLFFSLPAWAGAAGTSTPGDELRARLRAADDGATIVVAPGVYDGPFVLEKPVHLIGRPGATLRGDGLTHVVSVRAPDVEIAGFLIRTSGRDLSKDHAAIHISGARAIIRDNRILDCLHGIYVRKANDVRIEDNLIIGDAASEAEAADPLTTSLKPGAAELCEVEPIQDLRGNGIHLWNSSGHLIAHNTISGTRDGIYFSFTDATLVRDNTIRRVRYGLHYMYSDDNTFERNVFADNAAGAAIMYSKGLLLRHNQFLASRSQRAYGMLLQSVDDTRIEANRIEGNTLGLYLENGNNNTLTGNRIAQNYIGLRVNDSSAGNRFFANTFSGNIHPVETSGSNDANLWAVDRRGNYWDDAVRLDLDRDGISDLPHREPDLFGAWRRPFPAIGLLSASPGERLLRFIHSRLALPGLPGVTDPAPLVAVPSPP
jgi:nitrous oxidase accessory protein